MATADFFINTSDDKRADKTLTKVRTVTIEYKNDTSVVEPSIKVQNFNGIFNANYVYLSDFGRYYFIRGTTVSQQYVILQLMEDVRYTLRTQIRKCRAIIKRQENLYDAYLDDEKFKAEGFTRIQTYPFSNGFTENAFLLTIAGGR